MKKYKERAQNGMEKAFKAYRDEPISKGRNQLIIIADDRIPTSMTKNSTIKARLFQSANHLDDAPRNITLRLKTLNFVEDTIPQNKGLYSSAIDSLVSTSKLLLSLFGIVLILNHF